MRNLISSSVLVIAGLAVGAGAVILALPDDEPNKELQRSQRAESHRNSSDAEANSLDRESVKDLQAQLSQLAQELQKEKAENSSLRDALKEQGPEFTGSQTNVGESAVEVPDDSTPKLAISFGAYGEGEYLRNANWKQMASALKELAPLKRKRMNTALEKGTFSLEDELLLENADSAWEKSYRSAVLRMAGKLPSHGGARGEWSHPIFLANLMASYLDETGASLDANQMQKVAGFGDAFEKAWKEKQEGYGDSTLELEKLLDELELKRDFITKVYEILSPAQIEALGGRENLGRNGVDYLSPVIMVSDSWESVFGKDKEGVKRTFMLYAAKLVGFSEEQMAGAKFIFDEWVDGLEAQLQAEFFTARYFTLDEIIAAGRAQLKAIQTFLSLMPTQGNQLDKITKGLTKIWLPRINDSMGGFSGTFKFTSGEIEDE